MATTTRSHLPLLVWLALLLPVSPTLRAGPQGATTTVEITTDSKNVLVINGNEERQTLDATGRDVTINGNQNQVVLNGECHALTVSGNDNRVVIEGVTSISVPGNRNQVVWVRAIGGENPQVTDLGKGNQIAKRQTP